MSFACCFPRSDLKGAETKVVVCHGKVVGKVSPTVETKSVAYEEAEGCLFATCRLVSLQAASFFFAGSGPEAGRLRKRDVDFLIPDRGGMVHKSPEIGVYAEDRESEPRWTSMH